MQSVWLGPVEGRALQLKVSHFDWTEDLTSRICIDININTPHASLALALAGVLETLGGDVNREREMAYIEGFVVAVPRANKELYRKHAAEAAVLFKEFGVTRMVEAWGDDVPEGKITDFCRAVKAEADEEVVFSWFEYPDKATRDAANSKMMSDPRMKTMGDQMPFDGKRMIFGGFSTIIDV